MSDSDTGGNAGSPRNSAAGFGFSLIVFSYSIALVILGVEPIYRDFPKIVEELEESSVSAFAWLKERSKSRARLSNSISAVNELLNGKSEDELGQAEEENLFPEDTIGEE